MARLTVKVVPKSAKDRIVGWLGDSLKVCVRAPPEKGPTNEAVAGVLGEAVGVPRSATEPLKFQNRQDSSGLFKLCSGGLDLNPLQRLVHLIRRYGINCVCFFMGYLF